MMRFLSIFTSNQPNNRLVIVGLDQWDFCPFSLLGLNFFGTFSTYEVHIKYAKACAVIFSVQLSLKDSQSQFSDVKMLRGFKCFELTTSKTFVNHAPTSRMCWACSYVLYLKNVYTKFRSSKKICRFKFWSAFGTFTVPLKIMVVGPNRTTRIYSN